MEHSYWRSIYTGQVYEMDADFMPRYGGWEPVHESTYIEWLEKMGMER